MKLHTKTSRRATKAMALLLAVVLVFGQEASLVLAAPPVEGKPDKAGPPEVNVQPEGSGPPEDKGKSDDTG
ncbi:MAG: hypothetical protein O3B65_02740, partial [Chloroflexi bacterium]|nr:hypothetical protein [Chloroflexota bacterium]